MKLNSVDFKVDKFGIIHASIGRVAFSPEQILQNATEMLQTV
jgi:large subunit ribosomal protein L1